jgi:hypothetical protein
VNGQGPTLPPPAVPPGAGGDFATMLGTAFSPQPYGYRFVKGIMGEIPVTFLIVEHAHGRFCVPFSDEEFDGLISNAQRVRGGGIEIARDMPSGPITPT